jgi:hypothetical protein
MKDRLQTLEVPLPLGGLNNTDDETSVPPNILVKALNVEGDRTGIRTRDGYSSYSISGLSGSDYEEGTFFFRNSSGTEILLTKVGADLYQESTVGVFASKYGSLSIGHPMNFVAMVDLVINMDGFNVALKSDGSNTRILEVVAPTVAPSTGLDGAAGNLTGDYQYKITFVSEKGAETNGGPGSIILATAADIVDITNIATGSAEVASRKIYRTEAGGSVFYYLATISDNTTTTYDDNIADVNLGTDVVPYNHDAPPDRLSFPTVYKEYLFGVPFAHPGRLYFSHQTYPEIFNGAEGTGYYIIVGLNDGENIIGVKTLRGSLFVFKDKSTWPVVGGSPDDFRTAIQPLSSSIGLYHRSLSYVDVGGGDAIIGLGYDGLFLFDGYAYKNIGYQPQVGINIQNFIDGLDKNRLKWATGFNWVKKQQYRCAVTESGWAYNNKEIIWDYRRNRIFISDIKRNSAVIKNNIVLIGSSTPNGKIYQMGGLNDDGVAIDVNAEWPWWSVGKLFKVKFDRLNIDTTLQGNYSITSTIYVDYNSTAYSMSLAGSGYWGTTAWTTSTGTYMAKIPLDIVGDDAVSLGSVACKLKLTHTGLNEPFSTNGLTLYYQTTKELASIGPEVTVNGSMGT